MSTLSDFVGVDIGSLANYAVEYQKAKNSSNASGDATTIDQLKGTVSVYETTNRALIDSLNARAVTAKTEMSKWLTYGAYAAGAFLIYKLVK